MRVNSGRKSWSEQQLARAWTTPGLICRGNRRSRAAKSLQHAEQLDEIL
jgi:hypothetical protein